MTAIVRGVILSLLFAIACAQTQISVSSVNSGALTVGRDYTWKLNFADTYSTQLAFQVAASDSSVVRLVNNGLVFITNYANASFSFSVIAMGEVSFTISAVNYTSSTPFTTASYEVQGRIYSTGIFGALAANQTSNAMVMLCCNVEEDVVFTITQLGDNVLTVPSSVTVSAGSSVSNFLITTAGFGKATLLFEADGYETYNQTVLVQYTLATTNINSNGNGVYLLNLQLHQKLQEDTTLTLTSEPAGYINTVTVVALAGTSQLPTFNFTALKSGYVQLIVSGKWFYYAQSQTISVSSPSSGGSASIGGAAMSGSVSYTGTATATGSSPTLKPSTSSTSTGSAVTTTRAPTSAPPTSTPANTNPPGIAVTVTGTATATNANTGTAATATATGSATGLPSTVTGTASGSSSGSSTNTTVELYSASVGVSASVVADANFSADAFAAAVQASVGASSVTNVTATQTSTKKRAVSWDVSFVLVFDAASQEELQTSVTTISTLATNPVLSDLGYTVAASTVVSNTQTPIPNSSSTTGSTPGSTTGSATSASVTTATVAGTTTATATTSAIESNVSGAAIVTVSLLCGLLSVLAVL